MFQDEQPQRYAISVFLGINQLKSEHLLDPGETKNAQNMNIDDGNLAVCQGFSKNIAVPFTSGVKSLIAFYKNLDDGTQKSYLLAASSTTLYWFDDSAGVNQWKVLKTGLLGGLIDYINYQEGVEDIVIMSNGLDSMFKWNGSNASTTDLAGSPPLGKSITLHFERIWVTNDAAHPNSVYYSAALNPEDWTQTINTGGIIELPTWDGGKCIGITNIFDDIVVFKTYNIWKINGTYPGEYNKQQVFSSTGAIAEKSIVNSVNETFFLAKDGIYVFNGTYAVKISDNVKDVIETMNPLYVENAVGVFYKNKYILAIPTGTSNVNDTVIEYDTVNKNFMVKKGIYVNTFLPYKDKLLFSNEQVVNGQSYVYEYNSGSNFDGTNIEAFYETPETDYGYLNSKKTCNYIYATIEGSGDIKIDAIFDGKTKSLTVTLPVANNIVKKRIRNKGRKMKFRFSNVNGSYFKVINPTFLIDVDMD